MKIFIKLLLLIVSLQSFSVFADSEQTKILVVGAGISGLGAAKELHDSGYEVTVLEARNKIGGRINTDRSLGFPLERGANWIHSNKLESNRLMSMKEELGLET
ncbi:MAG: FAD-dependent oxidoreductase, partial [Gammaproteobacteria bacterium]|nr:FAD-dependent oxidoreductase [Gammaproteobacteria bacterium]